MKIDTCPLEESEDALFTSIKQQKLTLSSSESCAAEDSEDALEALLLSRKNNQEK